VAKLKAIRLLDLGHYYLTKSEGCKLTLALFTGRVTRIESFRTKDDSNDTWRLKKITVAVQAYWLGVNQREIVIYTGLGNGDCGVHYAKGKEYFFWAGRVPATHLLQTNICGPTTIDPKLVADLNEMFGGAKSFL
jgi:hypothetical protein